MISPLANNAWILRHHRSYIRKVRNHKCKLAPVDHLAVPEITGYLIQNLSRKFNIYRLL